MPTSSLIGINDLVINATKTFKDDRGYFYESWKKEDETKWKQDNISYSKRGVLRGLHYQVNHPQGKLLRVLDGIIFDVIVDLRKSSSTFGNHVCLTLSHKNYESIWVPPGCAHGFLVLSRTARVLYKVDEYRYPEDERTLLWSDSSLNIEWPLSSINKNGHAISPLLSAKDACGHLFRDIEFERVERQ